MSVMPLQGRQDSKHFDTEQLDNTVRGELEGGYSHTRPRTTRKPRKRFKTGFTFLTAEEYKQLTDFYDLVGCHSSFTWTNPVYGTEHTVRFDKPFRGKYVGAGGTHRFDVTDITLLEK